MEFTEIGRRPLDLRVDRTAHQHGSRRERQRYRGEIGRDRVSRSGNRHRLYAARLGRRCFAAMSHWIAASMGRGKPEKLRAGDAPAPNEHCDQQHREPEIDDRPHAYPKGTKLIQICRSSYLHSSLKIVQKSMRRFRRRLRDIHQNQESSPPG